jgi:hypothetical protein
VRSCGSVAWNRGAKHGLPALFPVALGSLPSVSSVPFMPFMDESGGRLAESPRRFNVADHRCCRIHWGP